MGNIPPQVEIDIPADSTGSPDAIRIELWCRDPEVVEAVIEYPEGRSRDEFVRSALRIGVLALRQARGRIDSETIRNESERLVNDLRQQFGAYQSQIDMLLKTTLKDYFDPQSGRFNERVERLVRNDGDLERVMRTQVENASTVLKKALDESVGPDSALSRLLTPSESNSLITAINGGVDAIISAQRERVLSEFSLDNKGSALCRLLTEVSTRHGELTGDLKSSLESVKSEFSLDREDSALNRLVKRVDAAQREISAEFTLDSEQSALSRMRRELLGVMDSMRKESADFQETVRTTLAAMKARREESLASTRHGREFEQTAFSFIQNYCQNNGDIAESTGDRPGKIKHSKKGDTVIVLGPDCEAAGARIVIEKKEKEGVDLVTSLEELRQAKLNRDAEVGLFVHSRRTAPEGLKPFARYGSDVVVVWDPEDETTDLFLQAGLMVCKALSVRANASRDSTAVDFDGIEKAIREIERQTGFLDEIKTSSTTIKGGAEKILTRVESMRTALTKQLESLGSQVDTVKSMLAAGENP